jgi:chaperonin cofactor prefoldin
MVAQLANILARIAQEVEDVQRTLRVQVTRISELQADLNDIRAALKKLD